MFSFRRITLVLITSSFLAGIGLGVFIFQTIIDRDTRHVAISKIVRDIFDASIPFVKYSGTVLQHDETKKNIVLNIPNSFSINSSKSIPMLLPYDSQTEWVSIEYAFRNGLMEKRHWSKEEPRQVPRDALVSVVQYYDGMKWRTIAIAFLRKTNI